MAARIHRRHLSMGVGLGLAAAWTVSAGRAAPPDSFQADVAALCRAPHRLAGSPECHAAVEYVARRLREAGVADVRIQTFPLPTLETECSVRVAGRAVHASPMQECLWQAPVSGPEPIRGPAVYLPDGTAASSPTSSLEGAIAVLPYDQARHWKEAFALGARAILFVGADPGDVEVARYEVIQADLPRFLIDAGEAREAGLFECGVPIEIEARARWRPGLGENVLAWIQGSNAVFSLGTEEAVVFSAPLDTYGQAPTRVPGAQGAANGAALLALAERLARHPPARHVLLAFLGAETRCLSGSAALYHAIFRARPFETEQRTHADFIAEHESEKAFLETMADALRSGHLFVARGEAGRQALEGMRREADHQAEEIRVRLRALRLQWEAARRTSPTEADEARRRIEEAQAEEASWNALRRALSKEEDAPAQRDRLDAVRRTVLRALEDRRRELEEAMARRRTDLAIGQLFTNRVIVLHVSLDLSDGGLRWGFAHGDEDRYLPRADLNNVGYYVGVFAGLEAAARDRTSLRWFEPDTVKVQLGPPLYFPAFTLHAGQMASRFGVYGLRVATCHDRMRRRGHPVDSLEALNLETVRAQVEDALPLLESLATTPALSLRQRIRPTAAYREPEWKGSRMDGCTVMSRSSGSPIANMPARGALLARANRQAALSGFDLALRTVVQQNGYVALGPWPRLDPSDPWCCVLNDAWGRPLAINSALSTLQRIELFPCRQATVVALSPPDFWRARTAVLNALNDGAFLRNEFLLMESGAVLSFWGPPSTPGFKLINRYGLTLLNADAERPTGYGLPLTDAPQPFNTESRSAQDLWTLNEHRLSILRKHRISNDSLEMLHGLAGAALTRSRQAAALTPRVGEWALARALSRRVYEPLVTALNDLVKAVVILMLLTIPFAYFLERLLVGTPHIYRQIGWYAFFFLVTFAVLYQVHPAFAIATEPVVIFLAFVIILLSSLVIFILLSRFQQEIRALQGMRQTVHTADVSRFGTVMAAIAMGISTMRRRPMRTLLTTVTVVLLTFSILSFASFDVQGGILRRHVAPASTTRVIWIHNVLWNPLSQRLVNLIRHLAGPGSRVTERRWVAAENATSAETFSLLASREDGSATVQIEALVGIEPADLQAQGELLACFPTLTRPDEFHGDLLFLPPALAQRLDLRVGDAVRVKGRRFVFGGATDDQALTRFLQIDRTPIFPLNYKDESLKRAMQPPVSEHVMRAEDDVQQLDQANLQAESAFLPCLTATQVGFVHARGAEALGGRLVGLSLYPDEDEDVGALADRIARVSPAPVYVTLGDGTYRLYFTSVLSATGFGSILVPILLGGLIVFGTMLGSVSDREQEIYAFSALGLAPAHVGMLFFAEASVYAVVGGLGGYILAQSVVFGIGLLSRFTTVHAPEMNYSSMNAIFAIVTVMGTVLLSTVYPALRASRSANPGVIRTWRVPRPQGDDWRFAFPFTVSEYDMTGVMSFLLEHFRNFSDCSLGVFLAEQPRVEAEGRSLRISARISTAPFDLGVTEEFALTSLPSEVEGVDEVHVAIRRLSGTRGDWIRTNRPFISDLRRQFLIWRSLPAETTELYRSRTLALLGRSAPAPGGGQPGEGSPGEDGETLRSGGSAGPAQARA